MNVRNPKLFFGLFLFFAAVVLSSAPADAAETTLYLSYCENGISPDGICIGQEIAGDRIHIAVFPESQARRHIPSRPSAGAIS